MIELLGALCTVLLAAWMILFAIGMVRYKP